MNPLSPWLRLLALLSFLGWSACTGGELVGLHVVVQPDGSGTVTARALVESSTPSPAEVSGKGVAWGKRAALVYSQGAVAKLDEMSFGDDSLVVDTEGMDAAKLTVRLKRSPAAGWVAALVPDQKRRRDLATVYDPLGKTKELGDTLRLELVLPGTVNGSSVLPTARGVEAGREGNRAFLTIPVETARENGDMLSWDITWN